MEWAQAAHALGQALTDQWVKPQLAVGAAVVSILAKLVLTASLVQTLTLFLHLSDSSTGLR